MYPGWILFGQGDPLVNGSYRELINNARAYAYANNAGICWLQQCGFCPESEVVLPGAVPFVSPAIDPAPWYDYANPDSWGFLGVIGLEVTGADSSTRQVTVTNSITRGGVLGPPYFGPRTLVIRALAIATDDCALQWGLTWLGGLSINPIDNCLGDDLTFFDCCPCVCEDETPTGPCWADTYLELRTEPACHPNWWPSTYAELITGPPPDDPQWCTWITSYYQIDIGTPSWSCCVDSCVIPYMRQYHHSMLTEGPIVLQRPRLYSPGALAEIEFTIVAADPDIYALPSNRFAVNPPHGEMLMVPPATPPGGTTDPFGRSATALATRQVTETPTPEGGWLRTQVTMADNSQGNLLLGDRVSVTVRTFDKPAEQVRIGVWTGNTRVVGYVIPFVPARSTVSIRGDHRRVVALYNGTQRWLTGFVRDWSGGPPSWPVVPHGNYTVSVDQQASAPVRLVVNATTTATDAPPAR